MGWWDDIKRGGGQAEQASSTRVAEPEGVEAEEIHLDPNAIIAHLPQLDLLPEEPTPAEPISAPPVPKVVPLPKDPSWLTQLPSSVQWLSHESWKDLSGLSSPDTNQIATLLTIKVPAGQIFCVTEWVPYLVQRVDAAGNTRPLYYAPPNLISVAERAVFQITVKTLNVFSQPPPNLVAASTGGTSIVNRPAFQSGGNFPMVMYVPGEDVLNVVIRSPDLTIIGNPYTGASADATALLRIAGVRLTGFFLSKLLFDRHVKL